MSKPTPAVKAILAAVRRYCLCEPAPDIAAAVLLAAANQVTPKEACPDQHQFSGFADWDRATERWVQRMTTRRKIHSIARELRAIARQGEDRK